MFIIIAYGRLRPQPKQTTISLSIILLFGKKFPTTIAATETEQMMDLIIQGYYDEAADYVEFWDLTERERFITGFEQFFSDDKRLVNYRRIGFNKKDYFLLGSVTIDLETDSNSFCFCINIAKYTGKLYPACVDVISASNEEMAMQLANELENIMGTHYVD